MAHPARILAAALLAAVLAAPAALHASGLPDSRQATRGDSGMSIRSAGGWSFDWLFRLLGQVFPKEGGGLDPNGKPTVAPSPTPSDTGGGLDPNGGRV
jgi:hypothetical protein